jgi:hypothetical protein
MRFVKVDHHADPHGSALFNPVPPAFGEIIEYHSQHRRRGIHSDGCYFGQFDCNPKLQVNFRQGKSARSHSG